MTNFLMQYMPEPVNVMQVHELLKLVYVCDDKCEKRGRCCGVEGIFI